MLRAKGGAKRARVILHFDKMTPRSLQVGRDVPGCKEGRAHSKLEPEYFFRLALKWPHRCSERPLNVQRSALVIPQTSRLLMAEIFAIAFLWRFWQLEWQWCAFLLDDLFHALSSNQPTLLQVDATFTPASNLCWLHIVVLVNLVVPTCVYFCLCLDWKR